MGSHSRQRSLRALLPLVLFWATTASALSLSNFGLITSSAVPISCILAYNSQISGCVTNDFVFGNTCSSECVRGLRRIQSTLQSVCVDVNAPGTSILGQVLLGNIVGLLCPSGNGGGGGATSTRTTSTTTKTFSTSTIRVVPSTTTSSRLQLTLTTVRPTFTTTTASASLSTTTSEVSEETTASSEEVPPAETSIPSFVQSDAGPTTTSRATSKTRTAGGTEQTTAPESGGGSPFDFAVQNNGALRRGVLSGWMMGLVGVGVMMAFR
ncbi:hypothetical protein QBC43DRAFT_134305 [Cladorrhinum sp. PSN259]|nr:hypothetical protein QBC43DRAFT_134305 [Cladorrhinum sp. PSN259]